MNSKILIMGLNGTNTEIAKNLTLKAVNIDIADQRVVTKEIRKVNFLYGVMDDGKTVNRRVN
jgi:molybdopterin/thiamine biosynthesis adenylyltransferase